MTIYDISKKAGVSIATVSRVLNGSDKVRPSTKKKVMDIIEKYDYTPNAFARGMGLHSLQTIGILCADSSDLFLAKAVYYLEQELQANGYESLLCCTGYNLEIKQNYLNLILSKKVDSIILVGSNFIGTTEDENQYIKDISSQVPIMLLNASFDYPNVYSTLCDDYTTMFEATESMLDSGIADPVYIYNSISYSGRKKLNGFKDALKKHGISDIENRIHKYDGDSQQFNEIADFMDQVAKEAPPFHVRQEINASFNTKCTAVQAQIIGMSLRPFGLAVTVMIFLSLSVFLFDKTFCFFFCFSIKTGNMGDFVFHISKNENGNQSRIVLQDGLRAASYYYEGFAFLCFFPKEIELHEGNVVCWRTAHSLNGTVKEFVVLHLVEDLKLLAAYVVAVCHLSQKVVII